MSLVAKEKAGDFQQAPAGTHPAYCWGVIDIGHQRNEWQGDVKIQEQVILAFELPTEKMEETGDPMIIYSFYTLSLGKKANLRRDLEGWRGKTFTPEELQGFSLANVAGKACTLTIYHNENGKARIRSIGSPMKGVAIPEMHNAKLIFSLEEHGIKSPEYERVPEWIKEIIGKRVNPDTENPAEAEDIPFSDDIPFSREVA